MSDSISVEEGKQNRRKPPVSLVRIACEILAGMATGFAAAVPVTYAVGASIPEGCFGGIIALAYMSFSAPPVYGLGSSLGVYLVGSRGGQTGSFLLTLGCAFLGGLVMLPMFLFAYLESDMFVGVEKIGLWAIVLLAAPIMAMLGFNLTRRYKEPPSL